MIKDYFEYLEFKSEVDPENQELDPAIIEEAKEVPKLNIVWLSMILIVVLITLFLRLFYLEVIQSQKFALLSLKNRLRTRLLPQPRGIIFDRNFTPLVKNVPTFSLVILPFDLPQSKEERAKIYEAVAQETDVDLAKIFKLEQEKTSFQEPLIVKKDIDRETALLWEIRFNNIRGVEIMKQPQRSYLSEGSLSHILGYIGKVSKEELEKKPDLLLTSFTGKSGLEHSFDNELRGEEGKEQVEVDSKGRVVRFLYSIPPKAGNNLILSLDFRLQKIMGEALKEGISNANSKAGVALAMDPQDGGILGMVSLPSYDNNLFIEGKEELISKILSDSNHPLVNRSISGLYPSGSSIKPIIASAGLEERVINEKTTLNAPGEIKIGEFIFPDWKTFGLVEVKRALAESSNVFFYSVGGGYSNIKGLGINKLDDYLLKFGFGNVTGVDLAGEESGLVPTPDWKKKNKKEPWYLGDTYHLSIGQGDLSVTPLQLLNAVVSIANDGLLLKPYFLKRIEDPEGKVVKTFEKEVIREKFISPDNLRIVKEGMRQGVTAGSGRILNDLPVPAASKTGTAQFGAEGKTHAWFIAFAPYDDPQIAILILVEGGGEGHATAAPIAKKILQEYFKTPAP